MKQHKWALLFTGVIAAATIGCASSVLAEDLPASSVTQSPSVTANETVDANYRIQEEDVLRMDVWGETALSNVQMQVTPDGKVNVAYIGEMQAAGKTQADLTSEIARKLEEAQILIQPKVVITLISIHRPTVRVLGAVMKSGEFEFKEGDRILSAVAQAGYIPDSSWLEKTTVTRDGKIIPIRLDNILKKGDLTDNIELVKGDVINIPPQEYANKFYVMGQVNRPMMYDLKDKTTVLSAINLAGGITDRASLQSTLVIRGDKDKPEKVKCDIAKLISKGDRSQDIELKPGDVVYVPETNKPNWSTISQILSTISSLTYIRRFGLF